MYRIIIFFLLNASLNGFAQNFEQTYRNPVIAGDFTDPTIIRVGHDYYASGTTSDFVPCYPLYHSIDLVNWNRIGAVFNTPPDWIKGDCWAPELFYENGTYFVYYTARKKSDNKSCIGVATTKDITKGFEDHGILLEWGNEAIDAFVFKDDDEKLYVSWKAYGLDDSRPIEILCSELSADGLSLKGEHFTLTDHSAGWMGEGDEGQCLVKKGEYYYLFYSVGGCCDTRCNYRVCIARSKNMRGPWKQHSQNPILEGGGLWKCSGHGTVVKTQSDRYFYLYHAYHAFDFEFVGRQGLLDEILWDEQTGWPYFRYGNNPSVQAEVPFPNTIQKREMEFHYDFLSNEKDKYWIWDMKLPEPILSKNKGILTMTATELDISFRGINPLTGNYMMEVFVENNKDSNMKGLCVYGSRSNLLAWCIGNDKTCLFIWQDGKKKELLSLPVHASHIGLRIESVDARRFRFHLAEDKNEWKCVFDTSGNLNIDFIPQWGKGVRAGLFVEADGDSSSGCFSDFKMINN